jgi:hypothetical protein
MNLSGAVPAREAIQLARVSRFAVNMLVAFGSAAEGADQFNRLRIMRPAAASSEARVERIDTMEFRSTM